jgi:hypothetical protein
MFPCRGVVNARSSESIVEISRVARSNSLAALRGGSITEPTPSVAMTALLSDCERNRPRVGRFKARRRTDEFPCRIATRLDDLDDRRAVSLGLATLILRCIYSGVNYELAMLRDCLTTLS